MLKTITTKLGLLTFEFRDDDETGLSVSVTNSTDRYAMSTSLESGAALEDFVAAVNLWAEGGVR